MKSDKTKIAIVLVSTDGHARFLKECLQSLPRACDRVPYRVVLVDNDNYGESTKFVEAYGAGETIHLLHQSRSKGFAANVNDAARLVNEPFMLLLNVDTRLPSGSIERALQRMQEQPEIGALTVRMRGRGGSLQASARAYPSPLHLLWEQTGLSRLFPRSRLFGQTRLWYVLQDDLMDVDWISGAFMLLRTNAFRQVGGMDEDFFLYSEDTDLCVRLRRSGWRVAIDPTVEIFHWKDPLGAERRKQNFVLTHRSLLLLWRKHERWPTRLLGRMVLGLGLFGRFLTLPILLRKGRRYFYESLSAYLTVAHLLFQK